MAKGRTRQLSIQPGMSADMLRLISEQRQINKEFDRRKPLTSPTIFFSSTNRPDATQNGGRIIIVRNADGSLTVQYSDGLNWQSVLATSISFATPTITYGTTASAGTASTTIRSDATLKFPTAIMSSASSSTLTLTDDATNQKLTGSLGVIEINPTNSGYVFITTAGDMSAAQLLQVTPRIGGSVDGIKVTFANPSGARTGETYRGFNFSAALAANITSCIMSSADVQFNLTPSAGSGGSNTLYQMRLTGGLINNANASFTEIVGLDISGPRRLISNPTVTASHSLRLECPTVSATEQIGLYIRQRTAQATATTRYGLKIDAQNSGTTRYAIHALTDTSYLGPIRQDDSNKHIMGTGQDAELYYDGTDLVCDPDVVGTGVLDVRGGLKVDSITNDTGLAHGVYTPTRSAEANLDSNVTMSEAQYMRVGNTVTVSGRFTADPTLTATSTSFEFTLPIASNIGAVEDAAGVAFCGSIAGQGAAIFGVVANDTAKVQWVATDVTSQTWSYTFTYQVI